MSRRLCADLFWIDRRFLSVNNVFVECVFRILAGKRRVLHIFGIGIVVGKQPFRSCATSGNIGRELKPAESLLLTDNVTVVVDVHRRFRPAAFVLTPPDPRVTEPQRRQDVQRSGIRPTIGNGDLNHQVIG